MAIGRPPASRSSMGKGNQAVYTAFDTLKATRALEASGIQPEQAEAIVQAIRSSRESPVSRFDLDAALAAMTYQLRAEINAAVKKMLLAQIAIAGLLFAALKLFGGAG